VCEPQPFGLVVHAFACKKSNKIYRVLPWISSTGEERRGEER